MTTKEQERKALAQIKKIVDGLGENSYIGTAFEGCFEIAEENIENDFGCSMQQRLQDKSAQLAKVEKDFQYLKLDVQQYQEEIGRLKSRIAELEKRTISPDDANDCIDLLTDKMLTEDQEASKAAQEIVRLADHPEAPEFAQAVRDNRNAAGKVQYYREILERIRNARNAGN